MWLPAAEDGQEVVLRPGLRAILEGDWKLLSYIWSKHWHWSKANWQDHQECSLIHFIRNESVETPQMLRTHKNTATDDNTCAGSLVPGLVQFLHHPDHLLVKVKISWSFWIFRNRMKLVHREEQDFECIKQWQKFRIILLSLLTLCIKLALWDKIWLQFLSGTSSHLLQCCPRVPSKRQREWSS